MVFLMRNKGDLAVPKRLVRILLIGEVLRDVFVLIVVVDGRLHGLVVVDVLLTHNKIRRLAVGGRNYRPVSRQGPLHLHRFHLRGPTVGHGPAYLRGRQ